MKGLQLTIICLAIFFVSFISTASSRREWRRVLASPDIPITSFSCSGRPIGYYADVEADCQVYHMCGDGGRQYSYLCPNTTLFHQRMLICAHWYQVNCSRSPDYFTANLLIGQRDKLFVDDTLGSEKEVYSLEDVDELQKLSPTTTTSRGNFQEGFIRREERQRSRGAKTTPTPPEVHIRRSDLDLSPSGPILPPRGFTRNSDVFTSTQREFQGFKPPLDFARTQSSPETTVTEPVTTQFRPTNVSFRSTIETPYSEPVAVTQTLPMTPREPPSPPSTETSETLLALPPSLELLPPFEEDTSEETNTIELRLEDPRRSLYIPDSDSVIIPRKEIIISIPVKGTSTRFKPTFFKKDSLNECKRCHPMFVIDKRICSPCLVLS